MNRLQAEFTAGRAQADVVLVADAVATTQLKDDGRLLTYAKAPADKVPAALIDPDKTFFGTKLITTGIAHTVLAVTAPTSWTDLLRRTSRREPSCRTRSIPAPRRSCRHLRQHTDLGWPLFRDARANGADRRQGQRGGVRAVARGEKPYGVIIDFMAFNAQGKGSPVGSCSRARASPRSPSRSASSRPRGTPTPPAPSSIGFCRRRRSTSRSPKAISRSSMALAAERLPTGRVAPDPEL